MSRNRYTQKRIATFDCRAHLHEEKAFVRAFRGIHTFRGDSAFSTWLTAIAMNSYRTPSSGFAAGVMEAVREAASEPPLLPFPWRRFAAGLV